MRRFPNAILSVAALAAAVALAMAGQPAVALAKAGVTTGGRIEPAAGFAAVRALDADGAVLRTGTALAIAPGSMLTACHVLAGAARVVLVRGGRATAVTPGRELPSHDLCLLGTPGELPLSPLRRRTARTEVGEAVRFVGLSADGAWAVSRGTVRGRVTIAGVALIASDAGLRDGMSGGGLFDERGLLLGFASARGPWPGQSFAVDLTALSAMGRDVPDGWPGAARATPPFARLPLVWPDLVLVRLAAAGVPSGTSHKLSGDWLYARGDGRCEVHAPRQGATRFLFRLSAGGVAAEVTADAVPAGLALAPLVVTILPGGRAFRLPAQAVARAGRGDDPAPWHVTWRLDDAASLFRALPAAEALVVSLPGGPGEKPHSRAGDQYTGEDVAGGVDIAAFDVDPSLLWNNLRSVCF